MIPTTRPPRGRSGSRDHTLAQLGQAGAGATRAVPQTVSCNQIWSSRVRRNKGNYRNTTTARTRGCGGEGMRPGVGPGPASLEGFRWLCRVGPAPIDAWSCAMGWAPGNARSHAARLTREQWLSRVPRPRGEGSLFYATREGVGVAGLDVPPVPVPAPTWWRHLEACAWVAAWLTAREREMLGPESCSCVRLGGASFSGCRARESWCTVPISSASFRAAVPPLSRSSSGASRRLAYARF